MIQFEVRGLPVPQGSAKAFHNHKTGGSIVVTQTPKLKAWRTAIAEEARKVAPPSLITEGVMIGIIFRFNRPKSRRKADHMITRPDIDKLVRAVLDACTSVIWKDDSQVFDIHAEKGYGMPGVWITISPAKSSGSFMSPTVQTIPPPSLMTQEER